MGFLKKETVYAFSGFEGTLLYKGNPAAKAEIRRTWEVYGNKGEDCTTTDTEGKFKFDSITLKYRTPFLAPFEFLSRQEVLVEHNQELYNIWRGVKVSKGEHTEFDGIPKDFQCELTEDYRALDIDNGLLTTNCHWKTDKSTNN